MVLHSQPASFGGPERCAARRHNFVPMMTVDEGRRAACLDIEVLQQFWAQAMRLQPARRGSVEPEAQVAPFLGAIHLQKIRRDLAYHSQSCRLPDTGSAARCLLRYRFCWRHYLKSAHLKTQVAAIPDGHEWSDGISGPRLGSGIALGRQEGCQEGSREGGHDAGEHHSGSASAERPRYLEMTLCDGHPARR